jgi:hypothetical protein
MDNCWDYNNGVSENPNGKGFAGWLSGKSLSNDKN